MDNDDLETLKRHWRQQQEAKAQLTAMDKTREIREQPKTTKNAGYIDEVVGSVNELIQSLNNRDPLPQEFLDWVALQEVELDLLKPNGDFDISDITNE